MPPTAHSRGLDPEQRRRRLDYQRQQLRHISDWLGYRDLNQKHIANILGVNDSVVSRYIAGETIMPIGALREIAILLRAHEGDIIRPPPADGLGQAMEDTIKEMDRLGPDQWAKLLEIARGMRGKSD
jgi:predicted XRE-type DNA-binding protein